MQDKSYEQWLTAKEQQKHPSTAKKSYHLLSWITKLENYLN